MNEDGVDFENDVIDIHQKKLETNVCILIQEK
jgi:hypothetical protein